MAQVPWAFRNLLDHQLRVTGLGDGDSLKVFLRVANQDDTEGDEEYATYGFQLSPTGADLSGFSDIEITPPPDVDAMTLREIGLNQTRLQFGAHTFLIPHSWVKTRMDRLGLQDPYEVFRGTSVIGLVFNAYANRIFSIESIQPNMVGDDFVSWTIVGNAHERATE